jgi:uncharacterized protein YuzE
MKIKYFQDTDTFTLNFVPPRLVRPKISMITQCWELDRNGDICAITIEHASERAEIPKFSYEQIPA